MQMLRGQGLGEIAIIFSYKGWKLSTVKKVCSRVDHTRSAVMRKPGSWRLATAFSFMGEYRYLKIDMVKTMGTRWKINAIWWNIKINVQKLADTCGCELPTNSQNFTQKNLTEVKIFEKVLGGLPFLKHPVGANSPLCFLSKFHEELSSHSKQADTDSILGLCTSLHITVRHTFQVW